MYKNKFSLDPPKHLFFYAGFYCMRLIFPETETERSRLISILLYRIFLKTRTPLEVEILYFVLPVLHAPLVINRERSRPIGTREVSAV